MLGIYFVSHEKSRRNKMESEGSYLGRLAYEAYCGTTGWKSAVTGASLPAFYKTPEAVQAGWIAASRAVRMELEVRMKQN